MTTPYQYPGTAPAAPAQGSAYAYPGAQGAAPAAAAPAPTGPTIFADDDKMAGGGTSTFPTNFRGLIEVVSTYFDPSAQNGGNREQIFFVTAKCVRVDVQVDSDVVLPGSLRRLKFKVAQAGDRSRLLRFLTVANGVDPDSTEGQAWAKANGNAAFNAAAPRDCKVLAGRPMTLNVTDKAVEKAAPGARKKMYVVSLPTS